MTRAEADSFLVIAPSGRDAVVIGELLASAGLGWRIDNDGEALLAALVGGGAAAAILTDDALARIGPAQLREALDRQPPWSIISSRIVDSWRPVRFFSIEMARRISPRASKKRSRMTASER